MSLRPVPTILAVLYLATANPASSQAPPLTEFVSVAPCRLIDTRNDFSSTPGPLQPGQVRRFTLRGRCGIPDLTDDGGSEVNQATALALNIVAVTPAGVGHLTAWPTNQPMPATSVINYSPGQNLANGVIVPMCDEEVPGAPACQSGDISFLAAVSSVHLVVDVTGYTIKRVMPFTGRHGAGTGFDNFPCVNTAAGVRYGLSYDMSDWANADALCPAGTWVCRLSDLGPVCDTSRLETACEALTCDGTCVDLPADGHHGWVVSPSRIIPGHAVTRGESGSAPVRKSCERWPAWCCSRN